MAQYRIKQFRYGPTKRCIVERRFLFMWWNVRWYHLVDRTFDIQDGKPSQKYVEQMCKVYPKLESKFREMFNEEKEEDK